jgi:hypothetical protein
MGGAVMADSKPAPGSPEWQAEIDKATAEHDKKFDQEHPEIAEKYSSEREK